jgi:hypothetical protein
MVHHQQGICCWKKPLSNHFDDVFSGVSPPFALPSFNVLLTSMPNFAGKTLPPNIAWQVGAEKFPDLLLVLLASNLACS